MKFITNKIGTGKSKSFADLVSETLRKDEPTLKTASVKEEIKVAEAEKDEADSSGQLDVEPLHQKGESTPKPGKKKETEAGSSAQDTDNENNSEADSSGQPEWEGKEGNANDPEAEKHRDGDGDQKESAEETEVKEAAGLDNFGDKKAEPFGKKDDSDKKEDDKEDCDNKEDNKEDKKDDNKEDKKDDNKEDKKDDDDKEDDKKEDDDKEDKEASAPVQFVKVANLDAKSKSWLRKYWSQLYPSSYADAMTADK